MGASGIVAILRARHERMTLPMHHIFQKACWALLALTLVGCDQSAPIDADQAAPPPDALELARSDAASALIAQIREHLAEDRPAQAQAAMNRLQTLRDGLPPDRQADIDRLDAMLVDERP